MERWPVGSFPSRQDQNASFTTACAGTTLINTKTKPFSNAGSSNHLLLLTGVASQNVRICSITILPVAGTVNVASAGCSSGNWPITQFADAFAPAPIILNSLTNPAYLVRTGAVSPTGPRRGTLSGGIGGLVAPHHFLGLTYDQLTAIVASLNGNVAQGDGAVRWIDERVPPQAVAE